MHLIPALVVGIALFIITDNTSHAQTHIGTTSLQPNIVATSGRDVPLSIALETFQKHQEADNPITFRIEPPELADTVLLTWTAGRTWKETLRASLRAQKISLEETETEWVIRIPTLPLPPPVPEEIEAKIRSAASTAVSAPTVVSPGMTTPLAEARTNVRPTNSQSPSLATPQPPPTQTPVATPVAIAPQTQSQNLTKWVAQGNASLLSVLQTWTSRAGWNLVYQFPGLPRLDSDLVIEGEFIDALQQLAERMNAIQSARNERIPKMVLYQRNQVLVVTTQDPSNMPAAAPQAATANSPSG